MYTLTRDHLDKKAGEKVYLTDDQLRYYVNVGLVQLNEPEFKEYHPEAKRGRKRTNGDT